jgi:hypothetical protein
MPDMVLDRLQGRKIGVNITQDEDGFHGCLRKGSRR